MPAGFEFPEKRYELWVPFAFRNNAQGLVNRGTHFLQAAGRLRGGASFEQAQAELTTITRRLTQAFPDKSFSGIGGVSSFEQALNYFLLGCGTVQVCTAAMLDHAIGPNVIKRLLSGMQSTMERHGWTTLEDFRGIRRDRIVQHSKIRRPDADAYHGGYDAEGYAAAELTTRPIDRTA